MTIGESIISEIAKQAMVTARDQYGPIPQHVFYVWSQNAAEQLEALVAAHVQNELQEITCANAMLTAANEKLQQRLSELRGCG